jgi:hypothetical protein
MNLLTNYKQENMKPYNHKQIIIREKNLEISLNEKERRQKIQEIAEKELQKLYNKKEEGK